MELPRRGSQADAKVRNRSLRTQQRAKSQCQFINPVRGVAQVDRDGDSFGDDIKQDSLKSCQRSTEVNKFPGFAPVANLTESLILAQDERWRRA